MQLWVRSQDKECLTNISNIQYVYKNYNHGLGTYYDNLKLLGTYKTKERAIEVLDEIQNILKKDKFEDERFCCDKLTKAMVYEMPKD